ncbi:MAG: thiamine-phosphate kinase [Hyphomicrobiales bacterium]|nr:MAG: thiamine-phosphate kinase [Hyphomicrobiales bacterium]
MTAIEAQHLSEHELIEEFLKPLAKSSPYSLNLDDDAALLKPRPGHDLVITKDVLVERIHFFENDPTGTIARKALRVNLSDLASKGARPLGYLLGLGLPKNWNRQKTRDLCAGFATDQETFDFYVMGGDTVSSPERLLISITAIGEIKSGQMTHRNTATAGDVLYVSGTIGDAALHTAICYKKLSAPDDEKAHFLRNRFLLPDPVIALTAAIDQYAKAAMDISDGLIGDLVKMCKASSVSAKLDLGSIPYSAAAASMISGQRLAQQIALTGGDDYELLVAVGPENTLSFEKEASRASIAVTRIGVFEERADETLSFCDAPPWMSFEKMSYEHFS